MYRLKYFVLVISLVGFAMYLFIPAYAASFANSIDFPYSLDSLLDALNYVTLGSTVFIISHPPIIVSLIVDDPDNLDEVYSVGDTITIKFDSDTNKPGGTGLQIRTKVNDLFTFTESIGQRYKGQWSTADTFTITIDSASNAALLINTTTVTPSGTTQILSSDETSEPSSITSPVLNGDFGVPPFPNPWMDGGNGTIYYDDNVGFGTSTPNSKLQIIDGYIQLDASSGVPPIKDCDGINEIGRMKVDDSNDNLYVCTASGWKTATLN